MTEETPSFEQLMQKLLSMQEQLAQMQRATGLIGKDCQNSRLVSPTVGESAAKGDESDGQGLTSERASRFFGVPKSKHDRSRCGALTRRGTPCVAQGNGKGGRCRNHGGLSTGPRTPEGKQRIAATQRKRWETWREAGSR
jgi:hypothetical protein